MAAIATAAAVSAVALPVTEVTGRALAVAVAVGVLAARFRRWPAAVSTAITAALIFPTCLAPDSDTAAVAGDPTPWAFTPLFALALLLGRGYRTLAHANAYPGSDTADSTDRAGNRPSLFVWPDRPTTVPPSDTLDKS